MINLRLQEILQERKMTLEELSNVSSLSEESIRAVINNSFYITEESASILRIISEALSLPLCELLYSVNESNSMRTVTAEHKILTNSVSSKDAFRLQILNLAQSKGISLEELSNKTGIDPRVIALYSTQPIKKTKLEEPKLQDYLKRISKAIECNVEDLQLEENLPVTRLRFREFMNEKGLTLDDLSTLAGTPPDVTEFIVTQPLDIASFKDSPLTEEIEGWFCERICPSCCIVVLE